MISLDGLVKKLLSGAHIPNKDVRDPLTGKRRKSPLTSLPLRSTTELQRAEAKERAAYIRYLGWSPETPGSSRYTSTTSELRRWVIEKHQQTKALR